MDKLLILKLFSVEYFVYLILSVATILAMVVFLKNCNENKQKIVKIVLVTAMGLFIVLEYVGRILSLNKFIFFDNLPLDSFHIFFVLSLIIIIKGSMHWQRFAYLIMLPIGVFSILFPSSQYLISSAFSIQVISYMIINVAIVVFSLLSTIWQPKEIEYKDILIATTDFILIVGVAHIINVILRFTFWGLHSNLFGTMGDDYNGAIALLFDWIPVSFVCLLPLIALLVGIEFLLVFPLQKNVSLQDRRARLEELVALGNMKAQQEYREKNEKQESQILLRSDNKATPEQSKNVSNKSTSGFVTSIKEIQTNKEDVDK
jgi:hypothetical protein